MSTSINRLIQLNAKADALLEFRRMEDEDESHLGRNTAIAAGVGVPLAGAGLYARGARYNAANNWEGRMDGAKFGLGENLRAGVTGLREDATRAGGYASGVGSGITEGAGHYGSLRAGAAQGLGLGRAGAARGAIKRIWSNLKNLRYESSAPLVRLNARLDSILEFRSRDDESHTGRNAAIGAGVLGAGGLSAAYYRGGSVPRPSAVMSGGDTWMNRTRDIGTRIRVGGAQLGQDASLAVRTLRETPEAYRHFRRSGRGVLGASGETGKQTLKYLRKLATLPRSSS